MESVKSPLMTRYWRSGSSGGFTRASTSPIDRPVVATGVTASPGQNVFSAKISRSSSGVRFSFSPARCSSHGFDAAGLPSRFAASRTSATGLVRMSGTPFTASAGFCSNWNRPARVPIAATQTSVVCCLRAVRSCSGVITRAAASASCKEMFCCFAMATARSNEVCLIRPEAICAAPTVSARTLDCANRTIPCWNVISRCEVSCDTVRTPLAFSRSSCTRMAPTGRSASAPSSGGAALCEPVCFASAARSAAGSNGLAKKAAGCPCAPGGPRYTRGGCTE